MRPSALDRQVTFWRPVAADDGHGGTINGFSEQFTAWAGITYLRGGEDVLAARLSGRRPAVLRVRKSAQSDAIRHDWKAVFDGQDYALRESPKVTDDRHWYEMLVEGGVAP